MRKIEFTKKFKRDFRRISAGQNGEIDDLLKNAVSILAADEPPPKRYQDHALIGEWIDHRDCHLRPDLILIYRKPDPETLQLVRLGTHSDLGL